MLCYMDKTFCPFFQSCTHGTECDRALTSDILIKAAHADLLISQYMSEPKCYEHKGETI